MKRLTLYICFLLFLASECLALPRIVIERQLAKQGRCFTVTLVSPEGISAATAGFLGKKVKFFRAGDDLRAIIGVPLAQRPGYYPLSLNFVNDRGETEQFVKSVKVLPCKFPHVSFWLKPEKHRLLSTPAVVNEWELIAQPLRLEGEEQAWQRKFILPVKGRISMPFGVIEKVNGKKQGRHRGCDIAVPVGSQVRAANSGTVVFAQKLTVYGGTMVVDHGQGIHTIYLHLSKFLAKEGQRVAKGEVIALSGNTGYSSGPHLHWGMSVHDLRVDPLQWTKVAF
ncbi:MAG: M23 family metallopeptidase [Candidatus Saganbacteria bacterium]|nr:M23 family metallopeptidase [Candidatus Saganbacteria bacterium]